MANESEEGSVNLELSYKEAAAFHMVYFLGALVLNQETDRIPEHYFSALQFVDRELTSEDVLNIRQKATDLVAMIPKEVRDRMSLTTLDERHDQDTKK